MLPLTLPAAHPGLPSPRAEGARCCPAPRYLPARQAVTGLPVPSQLDGRVFREELVDILHGDLAHIYINGALCRAGEAVRVRNCCGHGAALCCMPVLHPQHQPKQSGNAAAVTPCSPQPLWLLLAAALHESPMPAGAPLHSSLCVSSRLNPPLQQ